MIFKRLLYIFILSALFTGCSTISSWTYKENMYFTAAEKAVIDDVALSIDFRRGYDSNIKLNYMYAAGKFSEKEYRSRENLFVQSLKAYKASECLAVYKKTYEMELIAEKNLYEYKEDEEWENYTYIKKYILPEIKLFNKIFEQSLRKAHPSTSGQISSIKTGSTIPKEKKEAERLPGGE